MRRGWYRPASLRHVCGSIAAAEPLRRAAEQSPTLGAHVGRVRVVALRPCGCFGAAPIVARCDLPRYQPSARRPPGLRYPLRVLPPSALCVRLACVAAVVRRGPLSRYNVL